MVVMYNILTVFPISVTVFGKNKDTIGTLYNYIIQPLLVPCYLLVNKINMNMSIQVEEHPSILLVPSLLHL